MARDCTDLTVEEILMKWHDMKQQVQYCNGIGYEPRYGTTQDRKNTEHHSQTNGQKIVAGCDSPTHRRVDMVNMNEVSNMNRKGFQ